MKIYIDSEFKCHTSKAEGFTEIETDDFEGKCKVFIEGYRYIPEGYSWTAPDGKIINGKTVAPAEDYSILLMAQSAFEEANDLLNIIDGSTPIEESGEASNDES